MRSIVQSDPGEGQGTALPNKNHHGSEGTSAGIPLDAIITTESRAIGSGALPGPSPGASASRQLLNLSPQKGGER